MKEKNFDLSVLLKNNPRLSFKQKISFVWALSIPGAIAQISSILMQYIDAAMVGNLGENPSAAIGLVASSTWVLGSLVHASSIGYTVQVAHAVGAGNQQKAKDIFLESILICLVFSTFLTILGVFISKYLPFWLGSEQKIWKDASVYFLVYCLSTPFFQFIYLTGGMLQCSGNMKIPGILNSLLCILDALFNVIFIKFCGLGVLGAALGTTLSAVVIALILVYYTIFKSSYLKLTNYKKNAEKDRTISKQALKLAAPVAVEKVAFTGALVAVTKLIAPLGGIALAANSFAVTAEALCYMPGYGIQDAAATLTGQSVGAKRDDLTKSFSWITVNAGMIIMGIMGLIMFGICPFVFKLLTPVTDIQNLAIKILRLELIAEPLYGASIVASGALRGQGDTFIPSLLNLFSVWIVRLGLSILLVGPYGLMGIWIAMTAELCFRGIIFLIRMTMKLRQNNGKNKQ
ncbi:MAG: MATE family efflux transporter [Treponema sp.]|nr:MATE family efflux transporter [Treponema sp.]